MSGHHSERRFSWSILPPLPLMGVGTPQVESVEHYVSRLAWTVGVSVQTLRSLSAPCDDSGARQVGGASRFCGPGKYFRKRVENLERLTGVDTVRCGSFWVIDDVLAVTGVGRNSKRHRWCPQCFLEWDETHSWEPLAWIVDLQLTCAVHGCDLESQCRDCGSAQYIGKGYPRRRQCQRCQSSLSGRGRNSARPAYFAWTEERLAELIQLCATPGQAPISFSAYEAFVRGLVDERRYERDQPATVRAAISRVRSNAVRGRVTLRTLVNLCALQGISMIDMLLDPQAAASRPLIDLWAGYRSLELPNGKHAAKMAAYSQCIDEIMKRCDGLYLPSMKVIMRRMKLNRDLARELCVDAYEAYEEAYQRQGPYSTRVHIERAFLCAMEAFEAPDFNPFGPCDIRKVARRVAVASNFTLKRAQLIARAALYSRRALERAKAKLLDLPAEQFEEGRWLRAAGLDHVVEDPVAVPENEPCEKRPLVRKLRIA